MSNPASTTTAKAPAARLALRLAALALLLATVGFWAAKGAHTGWSQNQVPVKQTDEITGIEFVTYEKRFVPGVEFLGAGTGLAGALFVISLLFKRKSTQPSS
ncbi:hypothetical protein Verru16b_00115 [Lacunisphaera limnophila]|uniref:Uncharacterized protein n=1 Tax=Lacunisphaera limnophila TaxID=1838286 RepID=A0A1I7PHJ1_9BACT|nr:hypothetical protein [Lacunisphaera limnophila]AOS43075.1 hypothetical protein Verru16b_00115 [Lacunisphaera limnophila]